MLSEIISRVQRNHGLEHATIHVLSEKHKNFSAQGNSDHRGFYLNIYGDLPETAVFGAVEEAYRRMKGGETELAVHPNCGTVLLTSATLATLAAQTSLALEQKRQGRPSFDWNVLVNALPSAIFAVVVALLVSRPLGIYLQARYTTDGRLGDLQLVSVERIKPSAITLLFQLLLTGGSKNRQPAAYRVRTRG